MKKITENWKILAVIVTILLAGLTMARSYGALEERVAQSETDNINVAIELRCLRVAIEELTKSVSKIEGYHEKEAMAEP